MRIVIDPELCIGTGECVLLAPHAFALGESDAIARVLESALEQDHPTLEAAAAACPTGAISIG